MAMEIILGKKVTGENRLGFVAGAGDVEEDVGAIEEFSMHVIRIN